jgi:lysozyme
MELTNAAIQLIKHYESLHDGDLKAIGLQPKMCPAGLWTLGYGRAIVDPTTNKFLMKETDKKRAYELYDAITQQDAEQFLKEDLEKYKSRVLHFTGGRGNEHEISAMTSLCYNIGIAAFGKSSVLKSFMFDNKENAANAFLLWNKATVNGNKQVLKGLTFRRQSERHLFLTGIFKPFNK